MRCGILVLAAVAVALSAEARAQGRITGTVTAAQDGHPIPGATVTVVGTNRTGATANPMQAIQARAPGVDVVAGGSYRPGVPMNVTVRGVRSIAAGNQPLYVVDGVPLAGGIEDFNPAIIQSIEVLKDASATAVYGSRGSNGVILITTRRGAAGAPDNSIHVTYDAQYGGQKAPPPLDHE